MSRSGEATGARGGSASPGPARCQPGASAARASRLAPRASGLPARLWPRWRLAGRPGRIDLSGAQGGCLAPCRATSRPSAGASGSGKSPDGAGGRSLLPPAGQPDHGAAQILEPIDSGDRLDSTAFPHTDRVERGEPRTPRSPLATRGRPPTVPSGECQPGSGRQARAAPAGEGAPEAADRQPRRDDRRAWGAGAPTPPWGHLPCLPGG